MWRKNRGESDRTYPKRLGRKAINFFFVMTVNGKGETAPMRDLLYAQFDRQQPRKLTPWIINENGNQSRLNI